ncbi:MAG: hypothetical protein WCD77_00840 [Acidobacteriaceae bacterium]
MVIPPLRIAMVAVLVSATGLLAQKPKTVYYTWKSVQIVGGGFVDGIIFHPTAKNVRYARTDMGGAYRWNAAAQRWQPILDWVPYIDRNLMGVASIAVDPSDLNRVYLACGTYTNANTPNGAILRSDNRGRTFQRTDVPFKFGGNEDSRGNGERLDVDPLGGRVLYLGTRYAGLWRSADRGVTWTRVTSFPDVTEAVPPTPPRLPDETREQAWQRRPVRGSGIIFIKFGAPAEKRSKKRPSQTIYVGVSLMNRPNLFVSADGGDSWHTSPGEPTQYRPTRAALSPDGFLYVTYGTAPGPSRMTNGAVWKLNTHTGEWTEITPDRPVPEVKEFGYAAVSVDAHHPRTLIVSSFGRPASAGGEDIFRSTDGGATWKAIFHDRGDADGVYDYSLAPYVKATPIHWLFDIEIDPANPDHAMFTTGYGGWETFDLTASDRDKPTHWSIMASGIEETVALQLDSPTRGAHLITAIGDYGGFVHWDLNRPAPDGSSAPPRFGNTTGLASATLQPQVIVRVGLSAKHIPDENISYSLDEGRTWHGTAATPASGSRSGSIAVSSDGKTWVWTPDGAQSRFTCDRGNNWAPSTGLPANLRVIADPIAPKSFYAISLPDQTLFRSTDGAATFSAQKFTLSDGPLAISPSLRGDPRGGENELYAAPGRPHDLWFAAINGLYHAAVAAGVPSDNRVSFVRMPGISEIQAFGFGKAAPHQAYPALYLAGTVQGQPGVFRSVDRGQSWVRINDDQHQWGLILRITGDPRIYGRVYVGTHGRGTLYGDPR